MMNKKIRKKSGDELQGFLMWRNRGSVVPAKKGVKALTRERVSIKINADMMFNGQHSRPPIQL